ncbi:hypothetical protein HPB47_000978 [Ixodes persulcatus]|uniref:Uncharacterized protein n=1 Tax=Ixodes persulcatus TaxID=34615 RepID=A0AC60PR16_IXOPE|nr:hypothetical protein HPB47_000978 [Ixodes persulcatus]
MSGVSDSSGRSYRVQCKASQDRGSADGSAGYRRRRRGASLLLLGGCGRPYSSRTRRHTTSVEQVYRAVPWKAVQVGVRGPRGLYETVSAGSLLRLGLVPSVLRSRIRLV